MSNPIFNPLVALEKKPEITNAPIVNIRFHGLKKTIPEKEFGQTKEPRLPREPRKLKEIDPNQEFMDETEEIEQPSVFQRQPIKIVNKRKGAEYREQVLQRLYENADIPFVKINKPMEKTPLGILSIEEKVLNQPLKTGKRLVIKDTIIKAPEFTMEKIEEDIVEDADEVLPKRELREDEIEKDIGEDTEIIEKKVKNKTLKIRSNPILEPGIETEAKPNIETGILIEPEKKKRGRKPKAKIVIGEDIPPVDLTTAMIRSQNIGERLPKEKERIVIPASNFYMNNRKLFIQKLVDMFNNYRIELLSDKKEISCETLANSQTFDLLTHQKIARDYLSLYTPYRGLLLYIGLGGGKCHKKDTPIIMHDGSIKMVQDIVEGDFLMGDDSTPRTVTSLARGRDKMYEIIPIKGEKYIVNQEHILCLKASGYPKIEQNIKNKNYNVYWLENNIFKSKCFSYNDNNFNDKIIESKDFLKQLKNKPEINESILEISVNDYLELPNKKKALLKGYKVPVEFPSKELPIDPYMIGYWLGDGTKNHSEITCQDSTVLYYFANNLAQYNLSLNYYSGYTYGITGIGSRKSNVFLNTMKDLKMYNNKYIPMIYKCNSRENRLKLLAGLIDSDGHLHNGGFEFTQKNEKLMDDVIYLARSLGFSCYKKIKKTTWTYNNIKKSGTCFRISIFGNGIEEIPVKIPRKKTTERMQKKDVLLTGISIKYVNEDDYYGFTLDKNCRYLMGDFTVTHNTCTSIAIAEGMKSDKRIVVMTPASLKMNFFTEMKKCGDSLYKKNQYWEFINIEGNPTYVNILASALSLPTEYIRKRNGAWLVDINKEPNFTQLSPEDQNSLDMQLNEMIRSKYTDINYNGIRLKKLKAMTDDLTKNPFDNSVVIIDEAHNFVSRIVNKLKQPNKIPSLLYKFLLSANNARIVLLTGTPIINYPNEVGILYNILRGYIKTWVFTINVQTSEKITTDTILSMFDKENFKTYDYIEYNGNVLTITRNPFGFINTKKRGAVKGSTRATKSTKGGKIRKTKKNNRKIKIKNDEENDKENNQENYEESFVEHNYRVPQDPYQRENIGGSKEVFDKYDGVHLNESGNISDEEFQNRIIGILRKNGLEVQTGSIQIIENKALPDNPEQFMSTFINQDTGELQNIPLFQRRILGLTSYYRSAQETLLPSFVKTPEGDNYYIERIEMSAHQFGAYEKIRKQEADKERNSKKRSRMISNELFNISSTYRIFSRAACNFVFPSTIERPLPDAKEEKEITEKDFDNISKARKKEGEDEGVLDDEEDDDDGILDEEEKINYENRIRKALEDVSAKREGSSESEFLSKTSLPMYSPKFARVLENLQDSANEGLHLLYSNFRTIEGIGILKLVLEANGFAEFKIEKNGDVWEWVEEEIDVGKPKFVLYTGTEDPDEKEIKRNIYNSAWDSVPTNISMKLRERFENNFLGEVIKIFMITSSGAEGINLKNTRFVHIIEPYWHMVRVDQVVGRARRICSHQDLPEDMRNVKVFLYVTVFSEQQKIDEKNIELRIRDISRIDNKTPVTTDETLYELASIKQKTNNQILRAMKETAIDCQLYSSISKKSANNENLVCYNFGKIESNQYSSYPSFEEDKGIKENLDVKRIQWNARKITLNGIDYALNEGTMEVYDYNSYLEAKEIGTELVLIGKLVKKGKGYVIQ